ncbi:UNVERIFIED_CONTAM: hypothetical protein GTU68_062422 [Idotea baltica]|nr:hypothetical protein [Idotea baltica]
MSDLSHFDESGASRMVDVGQKNVTHRTARASAIVTMKPETLRLIQDNNLSKGNVFEVARLAGIMATKRTADLIPLCHPLGLDSAIIEFKVLDDTNVQLEAEVKVTARTGVEMEAMTAVSVAGLTIYDMCKAVDRSMSISSIVLLEKTGGKSGRFVRDESGME